MAFLSARDRRFLQALSDITYCNPFLPQRMEYERRALGDAYVPEPPVWSLDEEQRDERANLTHLMQRVQPLAESLRGHLAGRLTSGNKPASADLLLYEDLVLYLLYEHYRLKLQPMIDAALAGRDQPTRLSFWKAYRAEFDYFLNIENVAFPTGHEPAHLLACFFQIRRAFAHIFDYIVGASMPLAQLRAAVWESIFTHDLRRYHRGLYQRMADFTTLVVGPSGTGKELVARAIGQSRYIPFDPASQKFTENFAGSFSALNLSALSPMLLESELFGHQRGAFTGAVADREGWLEVCPPLGTVFLDEIGELDGALQVKLLRVLQTRTFQRLGDTKPRKFQGKVIAATNRDLGREMQEGRFRTDLYYRLCSDIITTPSLRAQLAAQPDDLHRLILFIARRIVPSDAESVAQEVEQWIDGHLGRDYAWPGNTRELEQCVRNVLIRRAYHPRSSTPVEPQADRDAAPTVERDPLAGMLRGVQAGRFTADQLLRQYCTLIYARTGSYEKAARHLQLDRRTVRQKIDRDLLAQLTQRDRLADNSS